MTLIKNVLVIVVLLFYISSCSNKNKPQKKEYKYSREWIEYQYNDGFKEQCELYIDNKTGDTSILQKRTFLKDKLIYNKSRYYNLTYNKSKDDTIDGRITFYNDFDNTIINPITTRELGLSLINLKSKDSTKIFNFTSDQNYIDFKYYSKSDTISGLIYLTITIDTINNGQKKTRIITSALPIDNKPQTNNFWTEKIEFLMK